MSPLCSPAQGTVVAETWVQCLAFSKKQVDHTALSPAMLKSVEQRVVLYPKDAKLKERQAEVGRALAPSQWAELTPHTYAPAARVEGGAEEGGPVGRQAAVARAAGVGGPRPRGWQLHRAQAQGRTPLPVEPGERREDQERS